MALPRHPWINALAAIAGAVALLVGVARLSGGFTLAGATYAVLGFLVLGWAWLDRRRFRRGTPESEVEGGHTIE